jgi:hypothetical protein
MELRAKAAPTHRRRAAALVMLAALVVFCAVQERVMSAGVEQYVTLQRSALATPDGTRSSGNAAGGRATPIDLEKVMAPWIASSVRQGLAWGAVTLLLGGSLAGWRSRRE